MDMIQVTIEGKKMRLWSRDYPKCTDCGTTKRRHMGRGLCQRCWNRAYFKKWRARQRKEANYKP